MSRNADNGGRERDAVIDDMDLVFVAVGVLLGEFGEAFLFAGGKVRQLWHGFCSRCLV